MRKCPFCDFENEDDDDKCLACGADLSMVVSEAKGDGYGVKITNVGPNKISVIKEIKEHLNCGLEEAKKRCESGVAADKLSEIDAEILVEKLQKVGAEAMAVPGLKSPVQASDASSSNIITGKETNVGGGLGLIRGIIAAIISLCSIITAIMYLAMSC